MVAFPDVSFSCALYRPQAKSSQAARHVVGMRAALHVASLLFFGFGSPQLGWVC
jgi:hypothetical protein